MPATSEPQHVAVVGAGVVGLSCALWLKRKGLKVTVIDPEAPGAGTSSGNACTIATYGCIPVNSPSLFKTLPSLLLSNNSPLGINPVYAIKRLGWMLDFLSYCRSHHVEHIISQLGALLAHTWDGLDPLLDMSGARDLIEERGFMHVYRDQKEFDLAWPSNAIREKHGAKLTPLNAGDIRDLEPNLKPGFERGIYFEGINQVLDPLALCQRYAEHLQTSEVVFRRARVRSLLEHEHKIELRLDDGQTINVDQVVVAAGAFAKFIDGVGETIKKLDTERGYHVLYRGRQNLLSRPVSWHFAGFYAVPMALGMRFAGTVEIAGYHQQENKRITNYLAHKANQMLGLPTQPDQTWLGFRPTFPDSLPAIGYSQESSRILYAVGHHHLGLTLSGITGKVISELALGETPRQDISTLNPSRFR